jgi:hypothetical protein
MAYTVIYGFMKRGLKQLSNRFDHSLLESGT